jgi:hypothetical protein
MKFFKGVAVALIIMGVVVILFTLIYGYSTEIRDQILSGLFMVGFIGSVIAWGIYDECKQRKGLDPWMRANIEWKEEFSFRAAEAFGRDTMQFKQHRELWLEARRDEYIKRYAEGNRRTI